MCNKVTFVLSSDRIVIRLLVDLTIDLKQFLKLVIYQKLCSSAQNHYNESITGYKKTKETR